MKKLLLTLAVSVCFAATAAAQVGWNSDEIGYFFDQAGTEYCATAAPGMAHAYLVIKNPEFGVGGWECYAPITAPADGMVLSYDLMGLGPINIYTPPYFMVGMGVPFPLASRIHVATANLFLGGTGAWLFYVKALPTAYRPSIPGVPCYAMGEDVNVLVPLSSTSGSFNLPVAQLNNGCGVVGAQDDTWGGVKSMYR